MRIALDDAYTYNADPDEIDWATIHAQAEGDFLSHPYVLVAAKQASSSGYIVRVVAQFDTSGLDAPSRAYLHLYRSGAGVDDVRLVAGSYASIETAANYGAVWNNVGSHTIGGSWSQPEADWIKSPDIVAAGKWAASATFKLGLLEYAHDWSDNGSGEFNIGYTYDHTGENAAFLELLYYPSGSPLSPSPTAMRGGPF